MLTLHWDCALRLASHTTANSRSHIDHRINIVRSAATVNRSRELTLVAL